MPDIKVDADCTLHVEVDGRADAPVLMLSNSLGTDLHMWDDQVAAFARHFRVVRYDRRGHGQSSAPKGPYSIERLGRDVLAVLDHLGIARTNWCGLSMGGMVGQWLGAHAADRIGRLILSNTACFYPDKTLWEDRIRFARNNGIAAVAGPTMERWFDKEVRDREPATIARLTAMFVKTNLEGYIGCCEALRDMDLRPLLPNIAATTLVIAGKRDRGTPLEVNEFIAQHIPNAKLAVLDAGHLSNIEQPQAYTDAALAFLLAK
jgi:3-oxoadipate enol-lactonase